VKPQIALAALGVISLVVGISHFYRVHAFSTADALHVGVAAPLALVAIFVSDYVRQHGGLAFVFVALIIALVAALNPAFAAGLGISLLGMSIAMSKSERERPRLKVVVLGAGVQGTFYGVRLARAGHNVTLVARGTRAAELRERGAAIENTLTGAADTLKLPVVEQLAPNASADLCFVSVRREQIADVLPSCAAALQIGRFVFMVNHANGSEDLFAALGRQRVVLGFPGAAGAVDDGVDRYVQVAEQPTAIEASALDVAVVLRGAGLRVELVNDMDSWLKRHAVFVTAICGAIYGTDGTTLCLSAEPSRVREFILAVREGWAALDKHGVAPAPLAMRAIFCWVPLSLAVGYWRRLLGSPSGDVYFGRHARHAANEMAALAADVRAAVPNAAIPRLEALFAAIDRAAKAAK
jgi:2-dehydropantoate 2-reductase